MRLCPRSPLSYYSIALYSPRPQQGKTTVARTLLDKGFELVQFSAPLRNPLYDIGLDSRHVEGELKEQPLPAEAVAKLKERGHWPTDLQMNALVYEGKWKRGVDIITPRDFMKAKALVIGDNGLIEHARQALKEARQRGKRVIIDDLRTPSQYSFIRAQGFGFEVWRLERPSTAHAPVEDSRFEGLLEDKAFEVDIQNDGTLDDLVRKVVKTL